MDSLSSLMHGFGVALQPGNLLFALIGSIIGTAVGVLPGIGPIAGIGILLPLTFQLDATGAIIMLGAIYYGAMYGGTITAVLMNVPGEGASAITCDRRLRNGQAGSRRRGAGDRRDRLVHRRHDRDERPGRGGAAARARRARLRAARVLRPDDARARPCSSRLPAAPRSSGCSAPSSAWRCRSPEPISSRALRG